ncbi:DUF397 domain-containing protein [Streptomyces calidiresistens]|uniref:DUF397 domain-containing protein n=1 Tax=Streptomyces calidiresistens TaxID=1485586 RepID=A0A7W3T3K4_9ACTN|nr:DUF397 domain-containing protein [Streptomyces calidiresistens]MBB0230158.1 DUF397 domain-containing protein [Streptomyces calidiresistens]
MSPERYENPAPRRWVRSSHSSEEGGECVEMAAVPRWVLLRDSKRVGGAVVAVPTEGWSAFLGFALDRGRSDGA